MRIVLATLEYAPFKGGIATYLSNVMAQFPPGSVSVLAPEGPRGAGDKETHQYDVHSEVPIYRRPLLSRIIRPRWLSALFWTDWLCRRDKPDLLIISHLLPMGVVAHLLKRWRGIPYAVILHGMDVALALEAGGLKRRRAAKILRDASRIVANSAYTARLAETAGAPKERITIVHPCPSFAAYKTVTREQVQEVRLKYGIARSVFTLLTLGRLVRRKGFDEAIEAVSILARMGHDVSLVIAGDGPERRRLETDVIRRGMSDHVTFLGRVPDEDLPALYAACDAFVMAPRSAGADVEGFGIVYLEAAMMAKPVIASRAGGVPEAVVDGKTGILVEPGSSLGIADAVLHMLGDATLAHRMGVAGRERAKAEFTWKFQTAPLLKVLPGDAAAARLEER